MPGVDARDALTSQACTHPGVELAAALLGPGGAAALSLPQVLAQVAGVFGAAAAGVAGSADAAPAVRCRVDVRGQPLPPSAPWRDRPELVELIRDTTTAAVLPPTPGGSVLAAAAPEAGGGALVLWLEAAPQRTWPAPEVAALALVAAALARTAPALPDVSHSAKRLEQTARLQRLDDAARVALRLAHDFGNVLTSILGFGELALGQLEPGSTCHGYVSEVHRAAEQGHELIQRMRWFGRRDGQPADGCSLEGVLGEALARARGQPDLGPQYRLDLTPALPPVAVDPEALRAALDEVLANAREAVAGPGVVCVAVCPTDLSAEACLDVIGGPSPGAYVEVAVSDDGPGISVDVRRRLLGELFVTTKPRHRGLGLAVVSGILRAHGGGLRLDAGPQGGTQVRLYFPAVPAADPVSGSAGGPAPAGGERVLVVDDDPMVLQVVCTTLRRAGYRVDAVGGGAEALACYAGAGAEPYRLVLSDVVMPRLGGVELARQLLGQDPGANLLFMSGRVSADFSQANLAGWQFDVLPKPFRPEGLLRAVRAALDRLPARAPAAPHGAGPDGLEPSTR